MKNINKILFITFSFLLIPFLTLLVGCGATPVNQVQSVSFLSDIQNEKGQAVFELDLGSPIKLPYKINPSSAYGYSPRFTAISGISGDNMETFSMDIFSGEFCINRNDFKDVEVQITVGSYTDICQITLKKYPTQIGIYDENEFNCINSTPEINLACGESYQINIAAVFEDSIIINEETGEKRPTLLIDNDYKFLVESDNNSKTLINIPNKNRLKFSAYDNYGSATIRVAICDYFGNIILDEVGNALLAFEIKINIYRPCTSMDINLSGADKMIMSSKDENNIAIRASTIEYDDVNNYYVLNFYGDFYDEYGRIIEDDLLKLTCYVDNTTYVTVNNEERKIYIKKPAFGADLKFGLKFWSNASLESGDYCMTEASITVKF